MTDNAYVPAGAKIPLDIRAFNQVWAALNGPGHHIRELQATRSIDDLMSSNPDHERNPLNVLADEYEAWFEQFKGKKSYHWFVSGLSGLGQILYEGMETSVTGIVGRDASNIHYVAFYTTREAAIKAANGWWDRLKEVTESTSYALICVVTDGYIATPYKGFEDDTVVQLDRRVEAEHILPNIELLRYARSPKAE